MRPRERSPASRPVFLFDFGGVLIKWKNNNPIFDYIADRYRMPSTEARCAFELALPRLETGDVSMTDFLQGVLGQFGRRLRTGDSPDGLWTLPFERLVRFRKGTLELVRTLRRSGYRVYLFSNTSVPHAELVRRKGWDRDFDGFLTSCELRSMKPSASAFSRALTEVGAEPSDVVFIDDKEENVRGAKDFGIGRAFRFVSVAQLRRDISPLTTPRLRRAS